jgi:hypothetical protein
MIRNSSASSYSGLLEKRRPVSKLGVVEQTLPGEEEPTDEEESERGGLPDGWIYDDNGWRLIILFRSN